MAIISMQNLLTKPYGPTEANKNRSAVVQSLTNQQLGLRQRRSKATDSAPPSLTPAAAKC